MGEKQPTWPKMFLILLTASAAIFLTYLMTNMRERVAAALPLIAVLLALFVSLFLATIFFFYLRPQYGRRSLLHLALFIAGHVVVVLLLWRMGAMN